MLLFVFAILHCPWTVLALKCRLEIFKKYHSIHRDDPVVHFPVGGIIVMVFSTDVELYVYPMGLRENPVTMGVLFRLHPKVVLIRSNRHIV